MRNLGLSLAITVAISLAAIGSPAGSQTTTTPAAQAAAQTAQLPPLTDFVGTYAYQGGTSEFVDPAGLVAVLDGGK